MVIEPSLKIYQDLLDLASMESPRKWEYSEQELFLTYFYIIYPEKGFLLNNRHMMPIKGLSDLNSWFQSTEDVFSLIQTVHFVCSNKPWQFKEPKKNFTITEKVIGTWFDRCHRALNYFQLQDKC